MLKFDYRNARPTPWGKADSVKELAPGVKLIGTPSHGGIMIGKKIARKILSEKCLRIAREWNQYYVFEEDCDISLVLFEHPEYWQNYQKTQMFCGVETIEKIKEKSRQSLLHWKPEYFL